MRVLHAIEGFDAQFGGIATCTSDLLKAMQSNGHTVELLTPRHSESNNFLGENSKWVRSFNYDGLGPVNYSRNAIQELKARDYELYHINGLWQHICHATSSFARKHYRPYVITPHGMLYPETLRRSYWKKWPMLKIWFRKDILNASCLHATCETEMQHLREFGYRGPIAVIGNPVTVPNYISNIKIVKPDKTTLGFLGRLHPRKHVENLLRGASLCKIKDFEIIIVGSGDKDYEKFLHDEVNKLGLENKVKFTGFLTGQEKFEQLARLSALFVPSDMENFGMIVPEALLVGTPVMASLGTPWKDLNEHDCGWWRDNSPESIAAVIDEVATKTPVELLEMGMRGRDLVLQKYEASKVAGQMLELYRWLLQRGEKPDFICTI